MRIRQLKKWAKNAKKDRTPYTKARNKGSKKDCRRLKALQRLSRKLRRERYRKMSVCYEALKQVSNYVPKNEDERVHIDAARANLQKIYMGYVERRQMDRDLQSVDRGIRSLTRTVESLARSIG